MNYIVVQESRFGITNALAAFQCALKVILASAKWQFAFVYFDDIFNFSKSLQQHMEHTKNVLGLLEDARMTLKMKKCHFLCESIDYFGIVTGTAKLLIARKTTEAILTLRYRKNVSKMIFFLGFCNVYRRFILGFVKIGSPLNMRLRTGRSLQFKLNTTEREAVDELRNTPISPPDLALPKPTKEFTVDSGASNGKLGCLLLQEQEDK